MAKAQPVRMYLTRDSESEIPNSYNLTTKRPKYDPESGLWMVPESSSLIWIRGPVARALVGPDCRLEPGTGPIRVEVQPLKRVKKKRGNSGG